MFLRSGAFAAQRNKFEDIDVISKNEGFSVRLDRNALFLVEFDSVEGFYVSYNEDRNVEYKEYKQQCKYL